MFRDAGMVSLTTGDAVMVSPISDYRRCRDGVSYF